MGSWAEHIVEMEEQGSFGLIEDPSGDIEGAIGLVQELIKQRVAGWEHEVWFESQKGAANQGKMMVLRAMGAEFTSFSEELEHILYLDHKHEAEDRDDIEFITSIEGETEDGE